MDPENAPGTDSFPAAFYKTSGTNKHLVLSGAWVPYLCLWSGNSFGITETRNHYTYTKKDADPHFIKNWRPLTLLNCDYKIATKAISNRTKLINDDQTGLIKGLFIGETIILIDSITRYAEQYIPRLLLFIDLFEKAFYSLKWSFVNRTLKS